MCEFTKKSVLTTIELTKTYFPKQIHNARRVSIEPLPMFVRFGVCVLTLGMPSVGFDIFAFVYKCFCCGKPRFQNKGFFHCAICITLLTISTSMRSFMQASIGLIRLCLLDVQFKTRGDSIQEVKNTGCHVRT